MRAAFIAIGLAALPLAEALACSPQPPATIYFDYGSAEVKDTYARGAHSSLAQPQSVEPTCVLLDVGVTSDPSEGGEQLGLKRVDVVRRFLAESGFLPENIKSQQYVTRAALPRDAFGLRRAEIKWSWVKGRMRCDPATQNDQNGPQTTCGIPKYAACYLELEDGTVCNINNVAEPNPTKYSVVLGDH